MRIPGRKAVIRSARWLRSRFVSRGLILGYHRVANTRSDPFGLAIEPQRFREHLEVIRRQAQVVRLRDLSDALTSGDVPDRAVAITLDDGYVDNLEHAKPALEAFGMPATVFVIAGALGSEMWWDELSRLYDADSEGDLLRQAHDRLHALEPRRRERELEELRSRAAGGRRAAEVGRVLDAPGLERLAAGGLVEIGAHGLTHCRLGEQSVDSQREEITRSRRALEEALDRTVDTFAYPHGSNSAATRQLVRESGFRCACASQPDVVRRGVDRFALPRFWVNGLDAPALARLLARWLGTS